MPVRRLSAQEPTLGFLGHLLDPGIAGRVVSEQNIVGAIAEESAHTNDGINPAIPSN
jgi:hypothetical protein